MIIVYRDIKKRGIVNIELKDVVAVESLYGGTFLKIHFSDMRYTQIKTMWLIGVFSDAPTLKDFIDQ